MGFKFESPIVLSPETLSKTMVTKDPFRFDGPASFTLQIDSSNTNTDNKELLFSIFFTKNKPTDFGASAGRCGWADISTKGEIGEGIAIDSTNKVKVTDNNYIKDFLLDHVYPQNTEILVQNQHDEVRTNFSMTFIGCPNGMRRWLSSQMDHDVQTYYNNKMFSGFVKVEDGVTSVLDIETNDYRDITTYKSPVLFQLGDNIGYRMYDFIIPATDDDEEDTIVDIFNLNHLTLRLLFEAKGTKFSLSALRDGDISYQNCLDTIDVGPFDFAHLGIGQFSPLYNYGEEYKANFLLHNVHISSSTPKFIYDVQRGLASILGEGNFLIDYNNALSVLTITLPYTPTDEQQAEIEYLFERAVPSNITVEYNTLPPDYSRIAFLESNGRLYIATGLKATNETRAEMKSVVVEVWYMSAFFSTNRGVSGPGFGVQHGTTDAETGQIKYYNWNYIYGSQYKNNVYTTELGVLYHVIQDSSGLTVNDVKIATFEPEVFETESNIYLGTNRPDQLNWTRNFQRIYMFKLSNAGTPQADYIPCVDETGRPCFYDLVSKSPKYCSTYNTVGDYYAGIETLAQLYSLLAKLPDLTGQGEPGELTIRLDAALQTDELRAMIDEKAAAKNWEITEAPELEL